MTSTGPGPDFDDCSRPCRKTGIHTLVWGDCAHGVEPEPSVRLGRRFIAEDGYQSLAIENIPVSGLAERIEKALRTIPVRLGPNALAMLQRGETVGLSGGEYSAMALAVAMDLAGERQ